MATIVAGITVGQSPRVDMTGDMRARLAPGLELREYGALDGLNRARIEAELAPAEGDEVLVSRMVDGSSVTFSGSKVVPLVQACIDRAEADGARAAVVLCTGAFPQLRCGIPLVFPQPLFHSVARALAGDRTVALMVPEATQVDQARAWWGESGVRVGRIASANPYEGIEGIRRAAQGLQGCGDAFLCLDCMGFSCAMRDAAREASGLDVLLPRTLVASTLSELLG